MTALFLALSLLAAPPDPARFLGDLFAGRVDPARAFAPAFLAAVPAEKIAEILGLYTSALGPFRRAELKDGRGAIDFERGTAPCSIHFDAKGLVDGLWFGPMTRRDDSVAAVLAELAALPGTVSVCLLAAGSGEVAVLNPDAPLAIGSTFKLYILKAMREAQRSGRLADAEVRPLDPAHVSLPTGILQDWPAGTPVTIASLATLMISISDNTATDHLLALVGRGAVEAAAPPRMRPLLSTREMFALKLGPDAADLRARFLAADEAGRRNLLAGAAGRLPRLTDAEGWETPVAVAEVEWHATTRELAETVAALGADPALLANPGLAKRGEWDLAAYKGGSEPGVLNYTHLLRAKPGAPLYAFSATINDPAKPVAEGEFTSLVLRLMELIRSGRL